jgi:4-aminobutyrate aminotransferase
MTNIYEENLPYMSPVWSRIFPIRSERAEGSYIYAEDGKKYLDFTCGIGVTNTGHCHPKVVAAIREQAGLFLHAQANIVIHKPMMQLIEELRTIVPPSIDGFFFSNSGAEAVEGALKLARNATGKTVYKMGPQLLPSGVYVAPYPYAYRLGMSEEQAGQYALEALEELLVSQIAPSDVAAMLIEPVLGEGGYVPPPTGFLKGLREICNKHGILLILDEVQSGFGRTGKWFAFEHYNVVPDIMTVAKGLASGMPLSGVFSSLDLMKKWPGGSHGGTYGGNAVACAAAVGTIQAMREENMLENAQQRGVQLQTGLRKLQEEYPQIGDVRGLGLMIGSEFEVDGKFKQAKPLVKEVIHAAEERGLLLLSCGTYDSTIRWIPPLNVTETQVSDALAIFGEALKETL